MSKAGRAEEQVAMPVLFRRCRTGTRTAAYRNLTGNQERDHGTWRTAAPARALGIRDHAYIGLEAHHLGELLLAMHAGHNVGGQEMVQHSPAQAETHAIRRTLA